MTMDISKYIDYTLLEPTATERDIVDLCYEAKENDFYAICINSSYVALAKQLLENSKVKVCTVVGFPLGAMSTASKVYEAKKAIEDGADEIDMVMNLGFFKSHNYIGVLKDLYDVKLAIGKIPLKVILEVSKLNKNEIIKACEICLDAKADYIKTSSGFSSRSTTLANIKIIKKTVKNNAKIIPYGGIKNTETAMKYLDVGVSRIGITTNFKTKNATVQK